MFAVFRMVAAKTAGHEFVNGLAQQFLGGAVNISPASEFANTIMPR